MKAINFFLLKDNFFKKRYRSRHRSIIRGHRRLKSEGQISKIADLKRILATSKLNIKNPHFSTFIMGEYIKGDLMELSIRQYLLLRLGAHDLNKALLLHKGNKKIKVALPLPKDWIGLIEKNGFEVAVMRSNFLWYLYLIFLVGYSFLQFIRILFGSILNTIKRTNLENSYIYFFNLTTGNIPKNSADLKSYDILSWYIKHSSNKANFKSIKHDVKGLGATTLKNIEISQSSHGPIPYLKGWRKIINFFLWGIAAFVLSLFDLMRGRWWHAFILNQAILAKQVNLSSPKSLATEYLFHNTNQTYRPLWTYTAENYGSKIILYFYSTNVENLNINPTYAWRCMTWPKYLVWDQQQAKFLERSLGNPQNIEIVSSVWFSDKADIEIPFMDNKKNISIFGVTPHRQTYYCTYAEELDYVIPSICNAFIKDILEVANIFDKHCLLKAKRDIERYFAHPQYRHFLNSNQNNTNLSFIDPRIAANRVINSSSMVISFPFTATALIAKEQGIPTCYYDPAKIVNQNHHGAHGIPIIQGKEALYKWVELNC